MSEILLRWLNDEVHLRNPVTDFETDFSNGYAFGELLDKHEMQPDFHLFIDGDHPDAKTNNFVLVEPTLRTLGVKFDSRSASQIMVGQPGAAQKLLYQVIYIWPDTSQVNECVAFLITRTVANKSS